MTADQAEKVVDHILASWPTHELPGQLPVLWRQDLMEADFECAVLAVDHLRRTRETPPSAKALLEEWKHIHAGANHPKLEAHRPDRSDYPESPYLFQSKKLIYGKGGALLTTNPAQLSESQRELRGKIRETAKRHELVMNQGLRPNAEMIEEVATLAAAVEALA